MQTREGRFSSVTSRQPAAYDDPCSPYSTPAMDVNRLATFDIMINRVKNRLCYIRGFGYREIPHGKAMVRCCAYQPGIGFQFFLFREINKGRNPAIKQGAELFSRGLFIYISGVFPSQQLSW